MLGYVARRTSISAAEHAMHPGPPRRSPAAESATRRAPTPAPSTATWADRTWRPGRPRPARPSGCPLTSAAGRPACPAGRPARLLALAAVLLAHFDVILLDEPTNDLDLGGLELLERHLTGLRRSLVMVLPATGSSWTG